MHYGIPAYPLPRADLMTEIRRIESMGVKITLNHKVEDLLVEQTEGKFDAVFVAIGAANVMTGRSQTGRGYAADVSQSKYGYPLGFLC